MRGEQYNIRPEGKTDENNRVNGWGYDIEPRFKPNELKSENEIITLGSNC